MTSQNLIDPLLLMYTFFLMDLIKLRQGLFTLDFPLLFFFPSCSSGLCLPSSKGPSFLGMEIFPPLDELIPFPVYPFFSERFPLEIPALSSPFFSRPPQIPRRRLVVSFFPDTSHRIYFRVVLPSLDPYESPPPRRRVFFFFSEYRKLPRFQDLSAAPFNETRFFSLVHFSFQRRFDPPAFVHPRWRDPLPFEL